MDNKTIRAKRLSQARKAAGLTQEQMAAQLSEIQKRATPLTVPSVSSWETGRRSPSRDMMYNISKLLNVSVAYLECQTDDPQGEAEIVAVGSTEKYSDTPAELIDKDELVLYDGKPVFVTFKANMHENQWGIINMTNCTISFRNGVVKMTDPTIENYYVKEPYSSTLNSVHSNYPLDVSRLIDTKREVFVEMKTTDNYIRGQYNGWYRHNENHSALINSIGLTLPYDGVGIAYNAYSIARNS